MLAALHATGIRIAWSAGRNRQHTGAAGNYGALRRGIGGLGGGSGAGEDEDDYECAYDMFHSEILPKLYFCKKISLDKPDDVTIGYKLE
jgi:hypothetical protein